MCLGERYTRDKNVGIVIRELFLKIDRVFLCVSFFIFGLIVGSFLNAVAWRLREGMSLGGRSMCPKCRAMIVWYDNIPLFSYIILGGKCRSCHTTISRTYPIIEGVTGILFALFGVTFFVSQDVGTWMVTGFYLVAVAILTLIFMHDLETMEIPDILLWVGVGWSLVMLLVLDAYAFEPSVSIWSLRLYSGIVAGLAGFFPLFLISALSQEKWMGMGDGFLAFFIGLVTGWPTVLYALTMGFCLGSMIGIFLVVFRRKHMRSQLPLGPFLVTGAILAILLSAWFPFGVFQFF